MAVEMLKQVGEAEAKADLIRKQANDAAKAAVDEAATKAKEIVAASEPGGFGPKRRRCSRRRRRRQRNRRRPICRTSKSNVSRSGQTPESI